VLEPNLTEINLSELTLTSFNSTELNVTEFTAVNKLVAMEQTIQTYSLSRLT
jgi:hypothetical protein